MTTSIASAAAVTAAPMLPLVRFGMAAGNTDSAVRARDPEPDRQDGEDQPRLQCVPVAAELRNQDQRTNRTR